MAQASITALQLSSGVYDMTVLKIREKQTRSGKMYAQMLVKIGTKVERVSYFETDEENLKEADSISGYYDAEKHTISFASKKKKAVARKPKKTVSKGKTLPLMAPSEEEPARKKIRIEDEEQDEEVEDALEACLAQATWAMRDSVV